MVCPKCGSDNVTVQTVNQINLKDAHHGIIWWIFIGCWWVPVKWILFTGPALLAAIFFPKKQKTVNKMVTVCNCQACGHSWKK